MGQVSGDIERLVATIELSERDLMECIRKAANKSLKTLSVAIAREVSKDIRVELQAVKERIKIFFATAKNQSWGISVITRSFPAFLSTDASETPGGWQVAGRDVKGGFSHRNRVWQRKGKSRLPIREIRVGMDTELKQVVDSHMKGFWKRFNSTLIYELKKGRAL